MTIEDWRKKIDEMDLKLVELINQRAAAAREIGKLKNNTNLPIYEPEREKKILEAVKKANPKSGTLYAWVMLEKAFNEAWFKRDEANARAAFEQVHDWSKVPHHAWLRVSAAIALVEGKPEECQRQAREALNIVRSLPFVHQLAADWLEELLTSSEVRC